MSQEEITSTRLDDKFGIPQNNFQMLNFTVVRLYKTGRKSCKWIIAGMGKRREKGDERLFQE